MRISRRTIFVLMLGVTPVAGLAFAFDGAPVASDSAIPVVSSQPGTAVLKKAIPPSAQDTSLTSLQYAAEGGHPVAQWKLGRMYANGDGVTQDDLRAFEYFSRIANAHAEDSPSAPQAAIVANAFVALGRYYLNGIPNSKIKSDPDLCHIPVVVLTTSSAEEDILRSYKLHANAYVTKPVDLDQFMSVVRQIDEFFVQVVRLPRC